jgi:hypothetical protein
MKKWATILYDVLIIKMPRRRLYLRERRRLLHMSLTKNNGDSEPWLVAPIIEFDYIHSTLKKRRQTAVNARF